MDRERRGTRKRRVNRRHGARQQSARCPGRLDTQRLRRLFPDIPRHPSPGPGRAAHPLTRMASRTGRANGRAPERTSSQTAAPHAARSEERWVAEPRADTKRLVMATGRSTAVIIAVGSAVCSLVSAGVGPAEAGTQLHAGVRAAAVGGTWHTAQKVPGVPVLNKGGEAQIQSVSCTSAGNCSAGGYYTDGSSHHQAFVVSQVNGPWHTAIQVPGTASLNTLRNAGTGSVSCTSAGNCTAGGSYKDGSGYHAFVVTQVNGTWRNARKVPGVAALDTRGGGGLGPVACTPGGNCSAGGTYVGSSTYATQPFVVGKVNGTWQAAIPMPGTTTLDPKGHGTWISSMSCGSAGNCSAGGTYADRLGADQVFVIDQVNGTWHTARQMPGTAALNTGGAADVYALSCASAGNCSAVGSYFTSYYHAYVASEVNGIWHAAIQAPGTATLNQGKIAYAISVSCASPGNCSAGGTYTDISKHMQAFVVNEVNGTWRTATEVPGTAALNTGGLAFIQSVSCTSAGMCSAGGGYTGSSGHRQAFVITES